ncbi:hypothetical protein AB1N83_011196 [Pleurotus pulmonarius]
MALTIQILTTERDHHDMTKRSSVRPRKPSEISNTDEGWPRISLFALASPLPLWQGGVGRVELELADSPHLTVFEEIRSNGVMGGDDSMELRPLSSLFKIFRNAELMSNLISRILGDAAFISRRSPSTTNSEHGRATITTVRVGPNKQRTLTAREPIVAPSSMASN